MQIRDLAAFFDVQNFPFYLPCQYSGHLSESIDDKQYKIKARLKVKAKSACVKPGKYEMH